MTMYGGWYAVALSALNRRAIALMAGPVQDRAKVEAVLGAAATLAPTKFNGMDNATFCTALLAFPERIPGCENTDLWIVPEYVEYNV